MSLNIIDNMCIDWQDPRTRLIEQEEEEFNSIPEDRNINLVEISIYLADYALSSPKQYLTLKARLLAPDAPVKELAQSLGISVRTVLRHLDSAKYELRSLLKSKLSMSYQ